MPGTWTDLGVAARLGLRELGRRLRGEREPEPDAERFEREMTRALAALPAGVVAEHRFIRLPASEPPWRDSGLALAAGDEVSVFAVGRVYASRALDVWVAPKTQLWTRVGEAGPIRSSTRDTVSLRAHSAGRLYLGNYFPNDWKDPSGARVQDDAVYRGVSGGMRILAVHWTGGAAEGLAALAATGDPLGLVVRERERLSLGDSSPPGWHPLWNLGETEIFSPCADPDGAPALSCAVQGEAGILQHDAHFPLRQDTELSWRWRVDTLPGLLREDSVPSHDYLSIAVEFENGLDLTYYWSRALPVGTGFWCPLPNWRHREYHVVIRTGSSGLGEWHAERRNLHADALRYLGAPPGDVVAVWLIAVSVFKRQYGSCAYSGVRLHGGGAERVLI